MRTSPTRSAPISPLYLLYISPVSPQGEDFSYTIRPWEGGDKVRLKRMDSVFVDIFTLRRYESFEQLHELIGVKKNGQPQSDEYVAGIRSTIETSAFSQGEAAPLCPFWHFNTRKVSLNPNPNPHPKTNPNPNPNPNPETNPKPNPNPNLTRRWRCGRRRCTARPSPSP